MKTIKMLVLAVALCAASHVHAQNADFGGTNQQVYTATTVPTSAKTALTSLLSNSNTYDALLVFAAGLYGWWKKSQASTSQKMLAAAIKGVEFATSLPEVQQFAQTVKTAITTEATALGVQDDLHAIVKNITPQNAQPVSQTTGHV